MEIRNKTTNIYTEWLPLIEALSDDEAGIIFKSILQYQSGQEVENKNPIWFFIKAKIDEYNNNFKNVSKSRSEAGKIGMAKRWNKEITNDNKCYQMITNDNKNNNKIKENKIKENKNNNYGELGNVKLTEEQYKTLSDKYNNLDLAIEKLDTWLGTSGSKNKNKNHFAYFKSNSWVWENLKEKTEDVSCTYIQNKEQENLGRLAELTKKKLEEDMLKRFDKKLI